MVERLNRTLKESIQAIQLQGEQWEDALVTALMAYRTTPHTATCKTPAEMMLGRQVRTRLNAAFTRTETPRPQEMRRRESYQAGYRKKGQILKPGTAVRLRRFQPRKGETQFTSPIKITRSCTPGTYQLKDGSKVNARRLFTLLSNRFNERAHTVENNQPITCPPRLRRSQRTCKPVSRFGWTH